MAATARIAAEQGSFNRICQVAPICKPHESGPQTASQLVQLFAGFTVVPTTQTHR